jgi:DNA polymerase-3 subunit epsilon
MSGAPALVAEHMALALFSERAELCRNDEGHWCLAALPDDSAAEPAGSQPRGARVLNELDYVVVDVETTGGSAHRGHRITEIAAVCVSRGKVVDHFESLVNPERSIPPMITAITNITWAMCKDAPRFSEICPQLLPLLQGRIFVAHNAEFDWRFVSAEVERATGRQLSGERVCTVRLARRLLPQLRSRRLDALAHYYAIPITARHRAGGDALATAHLLLKLLALAADHDCHTWDGLNSLLARRAATGRRRGRRYSAMPRGVPKDCSA